MFGVARSHFHPKSPLWSKCEFAQLPKSRFNDAKAFNDWLGDGCFCLFRLALWHRSPDGCRPLSLIVSQASAIWALAGCTSFDDANDKGCSDSKA